MLMIYEVEFDYNGIEYEYDINAITGEIIDRKNERDDDNYGNGSGNGYGGASGEGSTYGYGNGGTNGEGNTYGYGNGNSGTTAPAQATQSQPGTTSAPAQQDSTAPGTTAQAPSPATTCPATGAATRYINRATSIELALEDAGLTRQQASRISSELEVENGVAVYEVEFDYNGYEYSVTLNAQTGEIINREKEIDD